MAVTTWLRALDFLLGASDLVRRVRGPDVASQGVSANRQALGQVEARLGVAAVAAIKEAFDRDRTRMEFERAQAVEEARRAAALQRLERLRQSGERQLAGYRLQTVAALTAWVVSAALAVTAGELGAAAKGLLGAGWLLLLGALAASFAASERLIAWLDETTDSERAPRMPAAPAVRWFFLSGLALTASALLLTL